MTNQFASLGAAALLTATLLCALSCQGDSNDTTQGPVATAGTTAANGGAGGTVSAGGTLNSVGGDTTLDPEQSGADPSGFLSVGPFSSCIIDNTQAVRCFGRCGVELGGGSRSMAPADLEARAVAVGQSFACALLVEPQNGSDVRCWGSLGETPVALTDVAEIAAGNHHVCARTNAGVTTCFGDAAHEAPAGLSAKALAASGAMSCAVAADDSVQCWGPNVAVPPAELRATQIAVSSQLADPLAGPRFGCAVTLEGAVQCWGDDIGGVLAVPDGVLASRVAVGRGSACALGQDGSIACWGTAPGFTAPAPAGLSARALSMNFRTSGAIGADGSFVFWGDLRDGRGEPPAGVLAPQ